MEVTINYNGQAVAVEVTLEVYEFLDRADHKAGRPGHLHRGPAPPVPALCPGRFELRGDWNDLRLLKVFCPGLHYRGQKNFQRFF